MTVRKTGGRADPELVFGVLGILLLAVFPLSAHEYSSITRFKYLQMLFLTGICVMTAAVFLRVCFSLEGCPAAYCARSGLRL